MKRLGVAALAAAFSACTLDPALAQQGGLSSIQISDYSSLILTGLAIGAACWGGVKWVQGKVAELHQRINDVQRDYVRRDDFHREIGQLRDDIKEDMREIKAGQTALNRRFDGLFGLLGKQTPLAE